MQGEGVEQSIINALERIYSKSEEHGTRSENTKFDCVVIIRGGGATSDMTGFDTLALAENVANFPLPIITGIGHDRDESILDMVSHTRVKTPTAAAVFLIDHLKTIMDILNDSQERIVRMAQQKLTTYQTQLATLAELLPKLFFNVKVHQEARLNALNNSIINLAQLKISNLKSQISTIESRLPILLERRLISEIHRLQLIEEKAKGLDPALLLKRGYSITMKDGKIVRDPQTLHHGDEIESRIEKGTIKSIVK
jgi:exodeoxyribonuclease VII large subunit